MFSIGIDIILFVFGLVFGSFFNVLTMRYDGEKTLGDPQVIGGRSHCPHCDHKLAWFELIPVVSFVIQGGRCRHCKKRISWQYPIVELITAFIFLLVPWQTHVIYGATGFPMLALTALWVMAFSLFLIMTLIDFRLGIIPDELTALLAAIAIIVTIVANNSIHIQSSFLGPYATFFGFAAPFWWNHVFGAIVGGLFFGGIWFATRGRGMGFGDVKLAIPLGLLFGWPDILLLAIFAFVIGAVIGVTAIALKAKKMASAIPFGPFLAIAACVIFFFGIPILTWYFHALGF